MYLVWLICRLRAPVEEEMLVSEVGEIVEIRRPKEKKSRKWHLARVVDIDTDADTVCLPQKKFLCMVRASYAFSDGHAEKNDAVIFL